MGARTARAWAAGAAAALAIGLGACAAPGGTPTSGCTGQDASAGAPGDAEPMLVLGNLWLDPVVVYADGAVAIPDESWAAEQGAAALLRPPTMIPGYTGSQPGSFDAATLTDCELDVVVDLADDLLTDDVDFGSPSITDSGSTDVSYDGREYSIYAFSRTDRFDGGLSSAQRQARDDLATLWETVLAAADVTGELPVDRVHVQLFGSIEDAELVDWPLPQPLSALVPDGVCATVSDPDQVAMLADRVADGDLLEDSDYRLAIVTAVPGSPDC